MPRYPANNWSIHALTERKKAKWMSMTVVVAITRHAKFTLIFIAAPGKYCNQNIFQAAGLVSRRIIQKILHGEQLAQLLILTKCIKTDRRN